jgi:hypothetical protein
MSCARRWNANGIGSKPVRSGLMVLLEKGKRRCPEKAKHSSTSRMAISTVRVKPFRPIKSIGTFQMFLSFEPNCRPNPASNEKPGVQSLPNSHR